jgi:aspartate-semialdehyde dehydrogenase
LSKEYKVAVVGATGLVGQTMIEILESRDFPVGELVPLASERSAGETIRFRGREHPVAVLDEHDFAGVDIALFSAGGNVSAVHAPRAAAAGAVVIDNTSQFRYEDDIPLVVPEVNPEALDAYSARGIIANPNCSTIQLVVALKPIHDAVGIERVNVATYQAVSGAGKAAMESLARQTALLMNGRPLDEADERQQAFNAVPAIDVFEDSGYTREEMKLYRETRKILSDDEISVNANATAVRIPVFFGHSEAVHLETRQPISVAEARERLAAAEGVVLMDEPAKGSYPTPARDSAGKDGVFVGRIRADLTHPRGLNLWVVADNVRKGAALNSVQIAELLVKSYL